MDSYLDGMRRYFDFKGRSTKQQYWKFAGGLLLLAIVALVVDRTVLETTNGSLFLAVVYISHLVPFFAVTVRRLHDADRTGWLALALIIPLLNLLAFFLFAGMGSTPGPNRFGPSVGTTPAQQPVTGPTAPDFNQSGSVVERLEKLAALRASGAIDQGEFDRLKAAALTGIA